jgi:hypothetical protein
VHLARFSSIVFWSCHRVPAHSRGTCSSRICCCCTPYGIVPQERITLGSRSGSSAGPTVKYDYLSVNPNCSRIWLCLHYSSPQIPLSTCVLSLLDLSSNSEAGNSLRNCGSASPHAHSLCMCSWVHGLSISRNSKPGQYRSEWQAALNRHGFQRICKSRAAVTAHSVGLALQREHATEVKVVTPKQEIKDS